jgi:hypothetical protein
MARALAPFQLRGKIHTLIFKVQNDRQIAYLAPEVRPERHKERMRDPSKEAYRLNILEFAMASTIACEIYGRISPTHDRNIGPILRPYSQNLLTARLKQAACRHEKHKHAVAILNGQAQWYGKSIRLPDVVEALQGLDLSHPGAPSDLVRMNPIGPLHNPTAIRLTGIDRAAQAIARHGHARLECRFHIRQAAFQERTLTDDGLDHCTWHRAHGLPASTCHGYSSPPSDWIPTQIIPAEGLLLELPTPPADAKFVTAIHIEWREVRTVGRKIMRHHKMGIAKIVSVHGPAEAFLAPEVSSASVAFTRYETHQAMPLSFLNGTARPQARWQSDPQAFLKQALARLKPK